MFQPFFYLNKPRPNLKILFTPLFDEVSHMWFFGTKKMSRVTMLRFGLGIIAIRAFKIFKLV